MPWPFLRNSRGQGRYCPYIEELRMEVSRTTKDEVGDGGTGRHLEQG